MKIAAKTTRSRWYNKNYQEHDPGHGRGIAHVEVFKALAEQIEYIEQCRILWRAGAVRHQVGLCKNLKAIDRVDDQHEDDGGKKTWQRNVEESLPDPGAIDHG